MSGLSINMIDIQHFFPWVSFLAGLSGSLHCVGMCGGLVTASCDKEKDVFRYQVGRLLGYMAIGAFAGFLGSFIKFENQSPLFALIPGVILGLLFLFWGIQSFRGRKAELPMPKFMGKFYGLLWRTFVFKNKNLSKAFFTGLISIFLPCGLLYGIALGTMALGHPLLSLFSMVFFWIGTLPAMVMAPSLFQKVLSPLKSKLPKTYAISLILIGVMTVSFRVVKFQEAKAADQHMNHGQPATHHSCH